jgi:hypothetical protein
VTTVPVVTIPSYHSAVPVLVYHDLSNADERYTVTAPAFATQIAALHRAGCHTITAGQMLGFLHEHARLPDKPFLTGAAAVAWGAGGPIRDAPHGSWRRGGVRAQAGVSEGAV